MKINYLKDRLFDLLNDNSEELGISDIETHENENTFGISISNHLTPQPQAECQ